MPQVSSEAVDRVEYDRPGRTLFVRYAAGGWYAYLDVEPSLYARLLAAPSKGRFLREEVRDRRRYCRLDL